MTRVCIRGKKCGYTEGRQGARTQRKDPVGTRRRRPTASQGEWPLRGYRPADPQRQSGRVFARGWGSGERLVTADEAGTSFRGRIK